MPKKILVVEDEQLIGLMLAEEIKRMGCIVTAVVTSGQAAVRSVQRNPPDAVLMDISLAGVLDGIETARIIKGERNIPILFFTGHYDRQLLDRARTVCPAGIVDKLDSPENIRAALSSLLR
ncbi:MAG: response regulator [Desulfobulbus sp.]|nr:response regulator [Desulfobulbus sp.]